MPSVEDDVRLSTKIALRLVGFQILLETVDELDRRRTKRESHIKASVLLHLTTLVDASLETDLILSFLDKQESCRNQETAHLGLSSNRNALRGPYRSHRQRVR